MDTIVVAGDGSKHSEKVVDYATSLAEALGAKMLLVNVPPDLSVPEGYEEYIREEHADPGSYYESLSRGILDALAERVRKRKVPFETISGSGSVSKFVIDTAGSRGADIIVIGLFGMHGVGKIRALGSNARRIIESSTVPVVSVP